jgi:2-(1,2-epoxy-1,2-dihydrophenyl)acetyl-CoA isomerase
MKMETHLLTDRADGVVTVTLNQPEKLNAISLPMFDELCSLIEAFARDSEARVLVLAGAGGNFSSGADLTPAAEPSESTRPASLAATTVSMMRNRVGATALALHRVSKPTIAAVQGTAAGAGANLAFGCDLVFAAEGARFSQIFVRRGLAIDFGGSWLLPRLVGLQKAKELAFYGDWIDAAEALRLGLVTRTFPPEQLASGVREWAVRLAQQAPLAISTIKQSLNRSFELTMSDTLEQEAITQGVCVSSNDFAEAMAAFVEKRRPRFSGG